MSVYVCENPSRAEEAWPAFGKSLFKRAIASLSRDRQCRLRDNGLENVHGVFPVDLARMSLMAVIQSVSRSLRLFLPLGIHVWRSSVYDDEIVYAFLPGRRVQSSEAMKVQVRELHCYFFCSY